MKQTAVEWFFSELERMQYFIGNDMLEAYKEAKEMEKEQIMMAVKDSWYMAKGSNFQEPQEEQYYNETFKSE